MPPLPVPPSDMPRPSGLRHASLRLQLNLLVAAVMALFTAALVGLQLEATRASVREEILGSNRVATQLLERMSWIVARGGPPAMLGFLEQLGRVRANDIRYTSASGELLYRSPEPSYKQGRSAPAWFTALVLPELSAQVIEVADGARLTIEPNPSRAILDGWDDLTRLAALALVAFAGVSAGVFWAVGRTVRPLSQVAAALTQLERGHYATRLPPLPGHEARLIGQAVNRLGQSIEAELAERLRAFEAERSLALSREWAQQVEARLEAERREIAATLHDELGQSVTGIRSLARSLATRLPPDDALGQQAAQLIDQEAARLYDAMHGMIPRLTPLALNALGLAEALTDLVASLRLRHPNLHWHTELAPDPTGLALPAPVLLAAYRVAQEGLNNALKHSGAQHLGLHLAWEGSAPAWLRLTVDDDGCGLPPPGPRPARFGLLGLRERVLALGGQFSAETRPTGGTRLLARLPLTWNQG